MDIKPGMMYKGNVNGCIIKIVKADNKSVTYEDMQHGQLFSVGRKMFEHLLITEIKD